MSPIVEMYSSKLALKFLSTLQISRGFSSRGLLWAAPRSVRLFVRARNELFSLVRDYFFFRSTETTTVFRNRNREIYVVGNFVLSGAVVLDYVGLYFELYGVENRAEN